jgi:hypothetical protein
MKNFPRTPRSEKEQKCRKCDPLKEKRRKDARKGSNLVMNGRF